MNRWLYRLMIVLGVLTACTPELLDPQFSLEPSGREATGKVCITFEMEMPSDGAATKAMADKPDVQNMYVAVFGGSGYFNEWVPVDIQGQEAKENSTLYTLKMNLSTSDSRLRLHFIANSPVSEPPITGISSQDTEDLVMSRIRSTLGKSITVGSNTYNIEDAYWQKKILPYGVKPKTALSEPDEQGYQSEYYPTDGQGNYYPSDETRKQFQEYNESNQEPWGEYIPIPLVRNFARIHLVNLAEDVIIFKYALAYAPTEGLVAPILPSPYYADAEGNPLSNNNGVYMTPEEIETYTNDANNRFWYESFFINMQDHPLIATTANPVAAGAHPFNFNGYSPSDQKFGSYPEDDNEMLEWVDPARTWTYDSDSKKWTGVKSGESDLVIDSKSDAPTVMYVYERSIPTSSQKATRVIIKALKNGESTPKYYALDIVNSGGQSVALLRNNTYTVRLTGIELGAGQASIADAADAASASVSGDSGTQDIPQISDGKMSIGTSYTEQLFVQPGTYDVMFRFIPNNTVSPNPEDNGAVSLQVGWKDEEHNVFYPDELGTDHSSLGASFAVATTGGTGGEGKTKYAVDIEKSGGNVVLYVRDDNKWKKASEVQGSDSMEKWGRITFTTVGTDSGSSLVTDGYFNESRVQTIRVIGTGGTGAEQTTIYRDVIIRLSPRKSMKVECLQKYVPKASGYVENVRVYIPTGLPASIFPADFKIEPSAHSLTPNGDLLPVETGASIVPNVSGPSYFFIRELTKSEYDGLDTETIGETTWKYFDCHFKTTIANNASTVYVQNKYFVNSDGNYSGASDSFENYILRYFTEYGFDAKVGEDEQVVFSFKMDTAHASSSGGLIWWDKNNANAFSDTYRVLPKKVTVKLEGLSPDGTTQLSRESTWPTGVYVYSVGSSDYPTDGQSSVSLNLIASSDNYSVKLYTGHIDPVFDLYEPVTVDQEKILPYYSVTSKYGTYGWEETTVNPDLNSYYSYRSTNYHQSSSVATMSVTIVGYTEFTIYIRSYGQNNYDYMVVRRIGSDALTSWNTDTYNNANTKDHTRGRSSNTTTISGYRAVTFTTEDGLTADNTPHTFYIQYGKNNNTNNYDDRGYVLIPKAYNKK